MAMSITTKTPPDCFDQCTHIPTNCKIDILVNEILCGKNDTVAKARVSIVPLDARSEKTILLRQVYKAAFIKITLLNIPLSEVTL